MTKQTDTPISKEEILALQDAIELFRGKWKFCLLHHLSTSESLRFKDLQQRATAISPKVLAKELQDLEHHLLITRTVNPTKPITVSYRLTPHALESQPVLASLLEFGLKHRKKIKEPLAPKKKK